MKKTLLILIISLGFFINTTQAQEPTKQESLNALAQTLQGTMMYYIEGGPCTNYKSSEYQPSTNVKIKGVTIEYSSVIIEFEIPNWRIGGAEIIKRKFELTQNFFVHKECIFQSKSIVNPTIDDVCKISNRCIEFDPQTFAYQERSLKILNYLKKFITKDPFDSK